MSLTYKKAFWSHSNPSYWTFGHFVHFGYICMYVVVLNTLCLTSAGSQSSSSCTCFMCYYNTTSPTKSKETKETTFSLCILHKQKHEHPAKYFYMSTRATTTTYFSSCCVVYKFCIYSKHEGTTVKLAWMHSLYICSLYMWNAMKNMKEWN